MNTSEFDYDLPPELIAQHPLSERSDSRMMVVDCAGGSIEHRGVRDLPAYLRAGDLMVVNDTRVIAARLFGRRTDTGGRVEILLIEETAPGEWECFCRASGRPRDGMRLELADGRVRGEVLGRTEIGRLRLRLLSDHPLQDLLDTHGVPPLPPYIRRPPGDMEQARADRARYQTVFARHAGAVAAPTAGLHFDEKLLAALRRAGVGRAAVTLHVGPGTFKPVKADRVEDHVMEPERYVVDATAAGAIARARAAGGRVLAVGSTTVRTLETVAGAHGGDVPACSGRSALFIHPPFDFKVTDMMLTNFHLPKSTLLMMISAWADWRLRTAAGGRGDGCALIRRAYAEAVASRYRFYSYGDCMLLR